MRKILFSLMLVLSVSRLIAQISSEAISITRVRGVGDGSSTLLIGTNLKVLSPVEHKLRLQPPFFTRYVVSEKAFNEIKAFISKHCDTVNHSTGTTVNRFLMRTISKNKIQTCYIADNRALVKSYFRQLVKLIDKPPYQKSKILFIKELRQLAAL